MSLRCSDWSKWRTLLGPMRITVKSDVPPPKSQTSTVFASVSVALNSWAAATGQSGETMEGALVTVTGRVTALEADAFWLDDGSGAARVFFAAGTGLARPDLHTGETWQVSGVVVENTSASSAAPAYRLQPRFAADLARLVAGEAQPYTPGTAAAAGEIPEPTATAEQ